MSTTYCLNENCIEYCARLENEIRKLKTENNILIQKNVILTRNCEEYTAHNERQQMAHQLELRLARAPIKNLQIKIETLQQVNHELTHNSNALKRTIAEYEQKHIDLLESHFTNTQLHEQLKDAREQCKKYKIDKWLLKEQMHSLMHEIAAKDHEISLLDAKLKQAHHLIERRIYRKKMCLNENCMKLSESINGINIKRQKSLSQSSTMYYSSESATAVIYALRSSTTQSALHSVSNFGTSLKAQAKKHNVKRHQVSMSISSIGYDTCHDTSDKEEDEYNIEEEIVIGRFVLEEAQDSDDCDSISLSYD